MNQWDDNEWRIQEQYQISTDNTELRVAHKMHDGIEVMLPAQFIKIPRYTASEPIGPWIGEGISTTRLLQAFLDYAWEKGMRPKRFSDTANTLSATQRHLSDMRAIVGAQLNVDYLKGN